MQLKKIETWTDSNYYSTSTRDIIVGMKRPKKSQIFDGYFASGSRTTAPKENCPPILFLTLTLTLTGGQFSSGPMVWTPSPVYWE